MDKSLRQRAVIAKQVNANKNGIEMKILVAVKRAVDYNVKVRVKSDSTGVDIANVKMPCA